MNTLSPAQGDVPTAPFVPTSAAAPEQPAQPSAAVLVEKYRLLRDKVKEIETRQDNELKPYKQMMSNIESMLGGILDRDGLNSCNTPNGTFYKKTNTSYSIENPEALRQWAETENRPDIYENRVAQSVVKDMLERGQGLPPGIKVSSITRINIQK